MRQIARRALRPLDRLRLKIDRHRHMRHAAIGKRGAAGEFDRIFDMRRPHHPHVVLGDVHEEFVELDVLLRVGAEKVMELQAGNRQHRHPVELRVIEPVQEVNSAGSRRGDAAAEPAGEFGIAAGGESRCLLVPHLDKPHGVLMGA